MAVGDKTERIRDDVDRVSPAADFDDPPVKPYVPAHVDMPEFTWPAVLVGALLGILFGASSLYLVLKVGITVSASIPVAVLSITLFRVFSRVFGVRRTTILENNIVQTTGSAGESIAFGVGVTIPALMLLGFDMEVTRVMTAGVLGGLLGILMMIPLRRAFIVKQHKELPYPEGTACADVLKVGEDGGSSAKTVFAGFGLAFVYNMLMKKFGLWHGELNQQLYTGDGAGLKGGVLGAEITPELLGVGYIIGPRIASITFAGGVLAYLVLVPAIVLFGEQLTAPVFPAESRIVEGVDRGLIANMSTGDIRNFYILYIGAGAVAAGGIISMFQALPLIVASMRAGLRDIRAGRGDVRSDTAVPRTERDMPMSVVLFGSLGLVVVLAAIPNLGLGLDLQGLVGAAMIVVFGFLFVTVSSRLTGTIGSSSNPISGMTVATLLLTCLVFLLMGRTDNTAKLTALTVAAVVCVAASNGGTTAQDLKTGFLVGATPKKQQWAILIGALTSALVMGVTLLLLNEAGTVYTTREEYLPKYVLPPEQLKELTQMERPGGDYAEKDDKLYHVLNVGEGEIRGVAQGKYLVDDEGRIRYLIDPAINGRVTMTTPDNRSVRVRDDGSEVANSFEAPKTRLMALIIDGILSQRLPWGLVLIGVLIAVTLELSKVPSLPFAVGVYLPIQISAPIFIGGVLRWAVDRYNKRRGQDPADAEFSPGVLLCSGYIAGGAIAGVLVAFMEFLPKNLNDTLRLSPFLSETWQHSQIPALVMFSALVVILAMVGTEKLLRGETSAKAPPEHLTFKRYEACHMKLFIASITLIAMTTLTLHADEGMWLFNDPPTKVLKERYNFEPTADWLSHLQQSAVRFNSGGSGSFVSADGLVFTNHHVAADALQKLSTPERNLLTDGFRAKTREEELKCLDLELNVLMGIQDVTERVNAAVKPDMSPADAQQARRAVMNTIEKESLDKTGLRSDVVTLYQGGKYHLYQYKKYTDVRLVFAPEKEIAFFGGDPDNFEFPRYDLDIAFFRAYEDGKPAKPPHFLRWSEAGAGENELVFVAGHPGKTDRLNTVAHLEFLRDRVFPSTLNTLRRREVLLKTFSDESLESARRAEDELFSLQNSRKARLGGLAGLQDPNIMDRKQRDEKAFRDLIAKHPKLKDSGKAWAEIEQAMLLWNDMYVEHGLLERGAAFNTTLFGIARDLVRLAEESEKPNADRLREYRESNLESLKQELFSEAPIYEDLETAKLADSLGMYLEWIGLEQWQENRHAPETGVVRNGGVVTNTGVQRKPIADWKLLNEALGGKSPRDRAAELIAGTKLRDVEFRKKLADGGKAAIEKSDDPMIKFARLIDPTARELRKKYEAEVEEPQRQAYAKIADAKFALGGTDQYPDATFTLRLAYGTVKGFEDAGTVVPAWTKIGDTFAHAEKHGSVYPFKLPESWLKNKDKLRADTPFNFVSTADIIGGNSGSPVVNREGEVVGIIFDGNIESLVLDFVYTDEKARAVSVHSAGIMEALRTVYQADDLVNELKGKS